MWLYRIVDGRTGEAWSCERSHDYMYKLLKPAYDATLIPHEWAVGDLVCFDNRSLMHS